MRKAAVLAGLFACVFLGSVATAHAGVRVGFGLSIGVGPAIPYGYTYYPYPRAYYPGYYPYSYVNPYPAYSYYVGPRYYGPAYRAYGPRYGYRYDRGYRYRSRR